MHFAGGAVAPVGGESPAQGVAVTEPSLPVRLESKPSLVWWTPCGGASVTAFEFAKAKLTGQAPKLGENRKVTVKM